MLKYVSKKIVTTYLVGSVTTLSTTVPGRGLRAPWLLLKKNRVLIRFVTMTKTNGTEFGPYNCSHAD